ncbi:MAG: hypothetical protein HY261_00260 [Chloroflexi bacterium]|nr:hypothetical protein [Chloroflexota bacterium]
MRDLEHLAEKHFELCHSELPNHRAILLIWYADLGVSINGAVVNYHCPKCGRVTSTKTDEFVQHETRGGLICDRCRREPEERASAFD